MLMPRLTECGECADIQSLIGEIDCRLAELAELLRNNITLMLNKPISFSALFDLLMYKRILQYKYVNSSYACDYTMSMIASKVKLLKYK